MYTLAPQAYGSLVSLRRLVGGNWTRRYYHFNALGTTDRLTDDTQTVTDRYQLDPWGKLLATTGTTVNPFRFVGELGYYRYATSILTEASYVRARHYDPNFARWWSQDPLGVLGPDGANLYWYVRNRPTWGVDPSGKDIWSILRFIPCIGSAIDFFNPPSGTQSGDYVACLRPNDQQCCDPALRPQAEQNCRNCIANLTSQYLADYGPFPDIAGGIVGALIGLLIAKLGQNYMWAILAGGGVALCSAADAISTLYWYSRINDEALAARLSCNCP